MHRFGRLQLGLQRGAIVEHEAVIDVVLAAHFFKIFQDTGVGFHDCQGCESSLLRPILQSEPGNFLKCVVAAHQDHFAAQRMCSDQQIEGR